MKGQCPICDADVQVDNPELSEIVNCSDCGSQLVVSQISDNSLIFEEAPEVEEDWGE